MNASFKTLVIWSAAACLGSAVTTTASAETKTVYVSPEGNDAWSGKLPAPNAANNDGPVATPGRARDLVRALKTAGESARPDPRRAPRGNVLPERMLDPLARRFGDRESPGDLGSVPGRAPGT